MPKYISFIALIVILALTSGCTRNDAQREFEQEAYSQPSNFTRTTAQGTVEDVDEDDWRISPLFQGLIEVAPPYPNPVTTSQALQFEVEVTGVQSVSGIQVWTRFEMNNETRILYETFETLQPGLTTFQINPLELSHDGSVEGARGLNRVFLYDGNQRLISYGDIMVE